jgi:hypothetical protein
MKTKTDRKAELTAISREPNGLAKLRDIACKSSGRNPGHIPQSDIGALTSDFIREILDNEFPNDDSIPSGPS